MSINHNNSLTFLVCVGLLLGLVSGTVNACNPIDDPSILQKRAAQSIDEWQDDEIEVCGKALSGQMTVEIYKELSTNVSDEKILECALGDYVADPFYTDSYYEKVRKVKRQLVEALFSKELDIDFSDEYGGNLAQSIVFSSHSVEWRVKMLKTLKEKGGDLFKKNEYNRNALDYARSGGDTKIVEYLESVAEK